MVAVTAIGLFLGFGGPLAPQARAQGCDETGTAQVEIAKMTEDLDILLKDDRSIRLAGVKSPWSAAGEEPDSELASFIKDISGGAASLRVLTPIADRWGRYQGDLFVGGQNLQTTLAEKGLVVARPDDLRGPCWAAIRGAEAKARRDKAGFWAAPDAILKATDGAKLAARDGSFILASGEVRHVSQRKGKSSFVDFGAPGANALFLMIDNRALTRMEKLGFKLEQLSNRKILVRGVVLSGRSPHMVIDDLDAIEFWD
jgi:endonuclease YncB( thermonuclease family)